MKTIEITLYKFDELSEDAQQKAIAANYDFNVENNWWDAVYEDAKNIGLEITGFELDRGSYCKGLFINSGIETAQLIIDTHGPACQTYLTAFEFLKDYDMLVEKYSDGIDKTRVSEDNEYHFDEDADDLELYFLKSLLEDYSISLKKEYEYLTSEDAVKDSLISNDYDFTIEGDLYL